MLLEAMDQGLLKRNPAMTQQEFSDHWYNKHAPLVVPFFLHSKISYYAQVSLSFPPPAFRLNQTTHMSSLHLTTPYSQPPPNNPKTHGPLSTQEPNLNVSEWDGAAGMPPQDILDNPPPIPQWKKDYYREVILPDERRFLVSEALVHIKRVGPGTVTGNKRVVIQDGKSLVHVPESVWEVWRGYEKRGQVKEDKE